MVNLGPKPNVKVLLLVNGRKKNVKNFVVIEYEQEDEYKGEKSMEEKELDKYMGDIISSNAKNVKNVAARKERNKSIVICRKIMSSLNDLWLGRYHFEAAILLRNSLLISSLLSNSEAWHILTKVDLRKKKKKKKNNENLLAKILDTPIITPKEMLYLELAVTPVRFIFKIPHTGDKASLDHAE